MLELGAECDPAVERMSQPPCWLPFSAYFSTTERSRTSRCAGYTDMRIVVRMSAAVSRDRALEVEMATCAPRLQELRTGSTSPDAAPVPPRPFRDFHGREMVTSRPASRHRCFVDGYRRRWRRATSASGVRGADLHHPQPSALGDLGWWASRGSAPRRWVAAPKSRGKQRRDCTSTLFNVIEDTKSWPPRLRRPAVRPLRGAHRESRRAAIAAEHPWRP